MNRRIAASWLALLALTAAAPQAPGRARTAANEVLPFIHDDYAKALAEARARKVPIFIESWAPW